MAGTHISACKHARQTRAHRQAVARVPSLRSLNLRGCSQLGDHHISVLVRGLPGLERLSLQSCNGLIGEGGVFWVVAVCEGKGERCHRGLKATPKSLPSIHQPPQAPASPPSRAARRPSPP
jgi:hypothetical protein